MVYQGSVIFFIRPSFLIYDPHISVVFLFFLLLLLRLGLGFAFFSLFLILWFGLFLPLIFFDNLAFSFLGCFLFTLRLLWRLFALRVAFYLFLLLFSAFLVFTLFAAFALTFARTFLILCLWRLTILLLVGLYAFTVKFFPDFQLIFIFLFGRFI